MKIITSIAFLAALVGNICLGSTSEIALNFLRTSNSDNRVSYQPSPLDFYWVGNGGSWSDFASHWATTSGGSTFHDRVPTSVDNVFFDANSFSTSDQSVTLDLTNASCMNIDWSGVTNQPDLLIDVGKEISIYGSLTLAADMTLSGLGDFNFESDAAGNTVNNEGSTHYR